MIHLDDKKQVMIEKSVNSPRNNPTKLYLSNGLKMGSLI